jgi:hypothetical protein
MEELDLRMYFFVPYNVSEIQKGIQAGHAAVEYSLLFGNTPLFKEFASKHKTFIILNGGTTNNNIINPGSLQDIQQTLQHFNTNNSDKINYSVFYEPDLNGALSAICFICDQRVWDYENYPNEDDYLYAIFGDLNEFNTDDYQEQKDNWLKLMGGIKNVTLREILKGKRLA